MAEKVNNWTREELILALNLYLKLPFGKLHRGTPEVIHLSTLIGRTANAVAMRLGNFASVDPFHQQRGIKGLRGGIKQVGPIWNEFINNKEDLLFESEKILAEKEQLSLEQKFSDLLKDSVNLKGTDKIREVKTRINQSVFRQIVLANYNYKCAITGIDIPDLLFASHIIPWSKNENERLNPENGICLSPLYDRAFDYGYIGINRNYEIVLSKYINREKKYSLKYFTPLIGSKLSIPQKYPPKLDFLDFHMEKIFKH